MFFGPNIKKLKEKRDIEGLGKLLQHKDNRVKEESTLAVLEFLQSKELELQEFTLIAGLFKTVVTQENGKESIYSLYSQNLGRLLRHQDSKIRQLSTHTLLDIFRETYSKYDFYRANDLRLLIAPLFRGVDADILQYIMQDLEEKLDQNKEDIYVIALYAGGFNELIKLHQRIADDSTTRLTIRIHEPLSTVVLSGAITRKVGLKELLEIIPYGFNGTVSAGDISPLINDKTADVSNITKEMCEEAIKRLKALPRGTTSASHGTNLCSLEGGSFGYRSVGEILLKRLEGLLKDLSK